jgi:hypothetical protein
LYVNGPFAEGDEVIFESSHQLADGFPVKAGAGGGKTARPDSGQPDSKPNTKPAQPTSDF